MSYDCGFNSVRFIGNTVMTCMTLPFGCAVTVALFYKARNVPAKEIKASVILARVQLVFGCFATLARFFIVFSEANMSKQETSTFLGAYFILNTISILSLAAVGILRLRIFDGSEHEVGERTIRRYFATQAVSFCGILLVLLMVGIPRKNPARLPIIGLGMLVYVIGGFVVLIGPAAQLFVRLGALVAEQVRIQSTSFYPSTRSLSGMGPGEAGAPSKTLEAPLDDIPELIDAIPSMNRNDHAMLSVAAKQSTLAMFSCFAIVCSSLAAGTSVGSNCTAVPTQIFSTVCYAVFYFVGSLSTALSFKQWNKEYDYLCTRANSHSKKLALYYVRHHVNKK
jgi:hypothetical protein